MDARTLEVLLSPLMLAVFGLCIGSFLNVVIHRLPLMMDRGWRIDSAELLGVKIDVPAPITLSTPRSRCPACGHQIAWYENIPLLSYLRLGGKCSACKTPISLRYPAVELLTALLFAACGWRFGAHPRRGTDRAVDRSRLFARAEWPAAQLARAARRGEAELHQRSLRRGAACLA